jgi:hypothetical protein
VAGIIGAAACFPLDMAKTRLQRQIRGKAPVQAGAPHYTGMLDCIQKVAPACPTPPLPHSATPANALSLPLNTTQVAKTEGYGAMYQGLRANLYGIIFEKAIKLGVNDIARDQLADPRTGNPPPHTHTRTHLFPPAPAVARRADSSLALPLFRESQHPQWLPCWRHRRRLPERCNQPHGSREDPDVRHWLSFTPHPLLAWQHAEC